ncbi:hypothetical protein SRABI96_02154 [Peribacillus sp. Bi96]|uniref:hypothetical protein n=1 Tax=Peribacillus sp. Bi96 TaxID=2884273 RepID=UPI001D2395CE|nr:hypothetical protein [Peribacillus sp. Bi96]CAH0210559.1 hypothetical protein SRABI96_02154 [Peribacillus sp. Bi96]
MRANFKKYGQTIHLIGGHLVYISNMLHPNYIDGIVSDYDQYCIDLKNAISVGQTSVQSLVTITPPEFLDKEHNLLIKSYKDIINCLEDLLYMIDKNILKVLRVEDIDKVICKLKGIEQALNFTTISLINKIKLQPRR